MLAAVCYWGFRLHAGMGVRLLAGLGGPVVMAVLWGLFAAPRAALPLPGVLDPVFRVIWFALGGAALAGAGLPILGTILVVAYLANQGAFWLTHR